MRTQLNKLRSRFINWLTCTATPQQLFIFCIFLVIVVSAVAGIVLLIIAPFDSVHEAVMFAIHRMR